MMVKTSGWRGLALLSVLVLFLAACSRPGSEPPLPTEAAGGDVPPEGAGGGDEDPLAAALTQAAVETQQAMQPTADPNAGGEQPVDGGEPPVDGGGDTGGEVVDGSLDGAEPTAVVPDDGGGEVITEPLPEATAVPPPTAAPPPGEDFIYVVQPGDWIYQIGRQFGVDPKAIIQANPGINPDFIVPGQELLIPASGSISGSGDLTGGGSGEVPGGGGTHVVSAGENLFRIALRYGVDYKDIAAANGIAPPYLISPGQTLVIPAASGE